MPTAATPPHLAVNVADGRFGPIGYVVVDRPVRGRASGGVRFAPDVSIEELAALARSMTCKWAFVHAPMGGAKAGIFATPERLGCPRHELMEAFGRAIAPLVQSAVFLPGVDLGTTLDDLRSIMRGAGRPLPEEQIDGSLCTSLTVFEAIRQTVHVHGAALAGLRVALEGFGKVGSHLAASLAEQGARLVAVSTARGAIGRDEGLDVEQLVALKSMHGDDLVHHYADAENIEASDLFALPVDLLVPGARPRVIHDANVDRVQARFIVPIANVPLTPEAERRLLERHVVVVPDFVANCGGILASAMLGSGFDVTDARALIERRLGTVMRDLLATAVREGRPVADVARAIAWRNHVALDAGDEPGRGIAGMADLLRHGDWNGAWRRLAWRIHRRWPQAHGAIRRAAAERYADMTVAHSEVGA